jgi:hypothetical protein
VENRERTQEIPHLELHILDQLANVGDVVALCVVDGHITLHLSRHVARQVHLAQIVAARDHVEDDSRGEFVVAGARAIDSFKHVDGVPCSRTFRPACNRCKTH